jgi:hypothetical protein
VKAEKKSRLTKTNVENEGSFKFLPLQNYFMPEFPSN